VTFMLAWAAGLVGLMLIAERYSVPAAGAVLLLVAWVAG